MGARDLFDDLVAGGWARVQQWVAAQQPESLNLDFKRRRAGALPDDCDAGDKNLLGKAMSGFANVDGGVLVFGLETTSAAKGDPNRLASAQTAWLSDANAFKRAVQKVFGSVTTPSVPGVMIEAITAPGAATAGVVAVWVPSSEAKPHRTAGHLAPEVNNKYFMRTDTDTLVMPHEMLAALFGRVPPSRLRLVAKWNPANTPPNLNLYLANRGKGTAREAIVRIEGDPQQNLDPILTKNVNRTSSGNFIVFEPYTFKTLYAGFEENLGALTVRRAYAGTANAVRLKGTIFAADAQPVDFDEVVDFTNQGAFELPPP